MHLPPRCSARFDLLHAEIWQANKQTNKQTWCADVCLCVCFDDWKQEQTSNMASQLSSVQNPFSEPFSDHCSSTQLPRRMKWTKKFTDVTERSDANRKIDPFESRLFPSPPEAPIQGPYQHCENASPPTLQLTNR